VDVPCPVGPRLALYCLLTPMVCPKDKSEAEVERSLVPGIEALREYGLPARHRMSAAEDIADRLAPMGVFRRWVEHFLLPNTAVDSAFELTDFWAANPEAVSRLEIPREIQAGLEALGLRSDG
jgi:hypothetical protein